MQIPSKSTDEFIKKMTEKSEQIRVSFLEQIKNLAKSVPVKVMLGDSTIVDQTTFEPALIQQYYKKILEKIIDWETQGISTVNEKDLRRIFIKFETWEGNYILSCHMSLQYHALLYYKPDHKIIEIQKELSEILDKTTNLENKIAEQGNKIIQEKLKEIGQENADQQKLFEILFQNEELINKLGNEVYHNADGDFNQLSKRKLDLFKELDNMLIEIYHTSPVMIDEIRMMAAEEGCLCHFNLEHVKNKIKEGSFDTSRITSKVKENLLKKLDDVFIAIKI